jgi:hypothetical protein
VSFDRAFDGSTAIFVVQLNIEICDVAYIALPNVDRGSMTYFFRALRTISTRLQDVDTPGRHHPTGGDHMMA